MAAILIDAFEFCRMKERLEGESAVADFPRLASESVGGVGALRWAVQGDINHYGHPQLELSIDGSVQLTCQRCLKPFEFEIDSTAVLVLAKSEASADELDALLADEPVEVIVGSRTLNVAELIEDDALLALPLAPKHETCPDQLVPSVAEKTEKESPFSVLKNLKR